LATIFLFGQLNQAQDLDQGLHYLEKAAEVDGSPVCAQASFMLSCLYAGDHALIGLDSTK
jgi:TPR repeat protein